MSAADRAAPLIDVTAPPEDLARAETTVPLAADAAFDFICAVERLLRLNPHLEIEAWQALPTGFRLAARNELNEHRGESVVTVSADRGTRTLSLRYAGGLKRATILRVEPDTAGARLVATDHYPRIDDPLDPVLAEVDRGLIPWVAAIRRHLVNRRRWGWLPGWRWWHERFLPGMPPRHRRIVRMMVWISVIEFALFVAAVLVLRAAA